MSDYKPITGELRDVYTQKDAYNIVFHTSDFERFCDAIDAIHAQLEEENERLHRELRDRPIAVGADAAKTMARLERENEYLQRQVSRAAQLLVDAEKDRDDNYANWQDCKQKVLQHNITLSELDAEIERLKAEQDDWIELPKDADGETIRLGDDMEMLLVGHEGARCRVERISLTADGWKVDGEPPTSMRHYNEPTVEDVLREFFSRYVTTKPKEEDDAIIAEYAAKLQLCERTKGGDAE